MVIKRRYLVLVVAMLALLFVFVNYIRRLKRNKMNCILRTGQNIVCTLASSATNNNQSLALGPTSTSIESFDTSTAYLRATVTCGLINVAYSFFSAPGVPPCNDKEPVGFTSSNNAWCVVANLTDNSPDEAPLYLPKIFPSPDLMMIRGSSPVLRSARQDVSWFSRMAVVEF